MNKWELKPFVGVGPLHFGMSREEVRLTLPGAVKTFKKSPSSLTETDAFDARSIHSYYDDSSWALNFVEFCGESSIPLWFSGLHLQEFQPKALIKTLSESSYPSEEDGVSCFFPDLGLSVYFPAKSRIASLGVFERARFDQFVRFKAAIAERRVLRAKGRPQEP